MNPQEVLFLTESNLIEGVGEEGLGDSMKAYVYLMQIKGKLTLKHILKTHRLLMRNLNPRIAGKVRQMPVGIYSGGNLIRQCPNPAELNALLHRFLFMVGCSLESPVFSEKEKMAKECHIEFEKTHPFEDGNGRVGRLLWAWQRKQMGLPLLIIFDREKQEYYKLFK